MSAVANCIKNRPVIEHVFRALEARLSAACDVCKTEPAVYRWTHTGADGMLHEQDVLICSICAGMILLVGKPA
jgi:hypothetical protein